MQNIYSISVKDKIEFRYNNMVYKSNVQDIDGDIIGIDVPVCGNKYYTMHSGMEVEFLLVSNSDAYKCKSVVSGKRKEGELILILLTYPKILGKVQRREFYRVQAFMEIKYFVLPKEVDYTEMSQVSPTYIDMMKEASAVDLSGGGIRIVTKEKCEINNKVIVYMNLNDDDITVLGTIIRVDYDKECRQYKLGVRFHGNERPTIEKIIKYVFTKSREQIKYS